ncbi:hypothetical protein SDC9_75279 [bioreactor metagenome]|uniref:Uncharacterized protein n=1 Tax=bioreactor metagenome TaxID=1076179 RepID=A0A644YLK1_9ZZZZ
MQLPVARIQIRNCGKEPFRVNVLRIEIDVLLVSIFHEPSSVHDCQFIAHLLHDAKVMGNEKIAQFVLFLDAFHVIQHLRLNGKVQY